MKDAISKLLASRKALVLLVASAAIVALCIGGKLSTDQAVQLLTVTIPGWFIAHAVEESGKAKAAAMSEQAPSTVNILVPNGVPQVISTPDK